LSSGTYQQVPERLTALIEQVVVVPREHPEDSVPVSVERLIGRVGSTREHQWRQLVLEREQDKQSLELRGEHRCEVVSGKLLSYAQEVGVEPWGPFAQGLPRVPAVETSNVFDVLQQWLQLRGLWLA